MFLLYSLIYHIALLLALPFQYIKRSPGMRKRWLRERLGRVAEDTPAPPVWVHAVSVGEVMAVVPFVRRLKKQYPHLGIIVSTVTDTGQKVADERMADIAKIIYIPFDTRTAMERAVKTIRPVLFITVETELWPNAFRVMKKSGIPTAIVNGRLSESSFKGYRKIRFFMSKVLENIDLCCMQEPLYAERVIALGARAEAVVVTGNFKFDLSSPASEPPLRGVFTSPVIVAGSTHDTEEGLILNCFMELRKDFPSLSLLIAPRHPERFKEVEELLGSKGVSFVRRSEIQGSERLSGVVVILDTIGELFSVYSICDIAIVGGSFIRHGGQNPLEPAYWGKPVLCGPHMENFPFIEEFFREGGALQVTEDSLSHALRELLSSPEKRGVIGRKAKTLSAKNTGAVERTIKALSGFIR